MNRLTLSVCDLCIFREKHSLSFRNIFNNKSIYHGQVEIKYPYFPQQSITSFLFSRIYENIWRVINTGQDLDLVDSKWAFPLLYFLFRTIPSLFGQSYFIPCLLCTSKITFQLHYNTSLYKSSNKNVIIAQTGLDLWKLKTWYVFRHDQVQTSEIYSIMTKPLHIFDSVQLRIMLIRR